MNSAYGRKLLAGHACRKCGSKRRYKPRGPNRIGSCVDCSIAMQRHRRQVAPAHCLSADWQRTGWLSKQEKHNGIASARKATQCEACARPDPAYKNGRFCADHSDARYGGSGRYRGALCGFCNIALGFHERRGWPLTPWLERYLSIVAARPPLEPNKDQLELLQ